MDQFLRLAEWNSLFVGNIKVIYKMEMASVHDQVYL